MFQITDNPSLLECKEGDLLLVTVPILHKELPFACFQISELARACLRDLVIDGFIRDFTSLEMATTSDGQYVFAVLRERPAGRSSGGDSTL